MTDIAERAIDPTPAPPSGLLEKAINNLSLGLVIFDKQRRVVFCNKRYMEIYGLSAEQVAPGTRLSKLIQRRLDMGHKAPSNSDAYIRERFREASAPTATMQELSDGRTIIFTIYPMPDGGGMATHEDITEREEVNARLKQQHELLKQQEEALRMSTELGHHLTPAPVEMKIMGPAEAPVPRLKAEFRYQLLIKSSSRKALNVLLNRARDYGRTNKWSATALVIDVDPLTLL